MNGTGNKYLEVDKKIDYFHGRLKKSVYKLCNVMISLSNKKF